MKKILDAEIVVSPPAQPETSWPGRIEKAAVAVFAGLLPGKITAASAHADRYGDLTAEVGLAGAISGSLSMCCSSAAGMNIASRMLGVPQPSEEQIRAGLGELAHRIARTIRKEAAGPSSECQLSPPIIASNDDDACNPLAENYLIVFEFQGFPIWIRFSLYR
ncbi:MAG TPA: chemotaxis protein CheX [Patescibacteria group bacterium]|nr:chemotaxis protein CheX [Patescibacteria group bacterium]